MKKFGIFVLLFALFAPRAEAVNMVTKETYFDGVVKMTGLPDYPPFAYYENGVLTGALVQPTIDAMRNQGVNIERQTCSEEDIKNPKILITYARSGDIPLFAGAYANTSLFSGLSMLYPAAVTNPIHIITLYDKAEENIKTEEDLAKLRGVISTSEYYNDFILKKIKKLNVEFVDTPFDAYKKVILGQADYMLGSLYYNRIMISRLGLGAYLTYSNRPVFKMPIFVAMSKVTPYLSLYIEAFKEEFSKPEYARKVKEEIIRIIKDETAKNAGVIPPSFSEQNEEPQDIEDMRDLAPEFEDEPEFDDNITGARIVEEEAEKPQPKKTLHDILEGM